ncbi:hypothetical protein [Actinomadura terrae]|uniref:hypothetical protein n=1 Tax=Actinomadura terrae TaxID=604353 RepID=UPI001FA79F54|nr:hypothetical protein [Actinomadura terrae]
MRAAVRLADRVERSPVLLEVRYALADGAYWGWAVALVAGAAVWVARGMPSPGTIATAAAAMVVGAGAGAWRAWRRARPAATSGERRTAALMAARRWLALYGLAAAALPSLVAAAGGAGVWALLPLVVAALVLAEIAVLTIPMRGRARLLARLRTGARAVTGARDDEAGEVRVGRALWDGRRLTRVYVTYPATWHAHLEARRDALVGRVMWDLVGPPPTGPAAVGAPVRPDYDTRFDGGHRRLEVRRVPPLPPRLDARDFGQEDGAIVLGETVPALADAVLDGVPVALYQPTAHLLIVGATQHGKSSAVRAWAVDGLTHGVFPGGLWAVDGKGSGTLAPLIGCEDVHVIAHDPDGWRVAFADVVDVVARRYARVLAWRSGQSDVRPRLPRALVVLDEIQQVTMAAPELSGPLDTLARQALESNVIIWVITQRPDARDAVPGAVRDQLVDRVSLGPLSTAGAKMCFDVTGEWHKGLGVAPVAGRALTWLGGMWRPVQVPWLPFPADVPAVAPLYPPRVARESVRGAPPAPPRPPRPCPAPAPRPAPEAAPDGGPAPYDPADPYGRRRRRRD